MKTTDLFQSILLFALFLCGLTACNDSDEIRLSPFQETTVKGEASTLQIDLTRGDWRITSITTPWGDLMMDGNKLPQLEGTGSLHYKWWDLERDTDSHLILHFKDNFDLGESRSLIINLEMKTGLYKEQIIIHQEPCTNFYQIESIEYSVEEGDGVKEAGTGPDKSTYKNENLGNTTDKHDYYPFINKWTEYAFIPDGHSDETFKSIDPEKRSIYLPNHIEDGKIIMGQQLLFFINQGKYYKEDELRYKHFEVDIVGMKWNIYHLLPAQCRSLPIGKLAAYQPTGRQRFHLCCKWQATAQSRYKRLIYQGIGSMQHHVAVTAFHLHHPAFQLIATAGSMTRTARKAYRHHSRYTYLYHNKHQLHKFRSVMGRIRLPLPHRVEVRTHHQSSWYHLFLSAQNHVRR